jgi:hypothetical protein
MALAPPTVSTSFDLTPGPLASAVSAAAAEVCAPQCSNAEKNIVSQAALPWLPGDKPRGRKPSVKSILLTGFFF